MPTKALRLKSRSVNPASTSIFKQPTTDFISVQSFDFDGCLFHSDCLDNKQFLQSNSKLWDYILHHTKYASEVICMVGSNRQSKATDNQNMQEQETPSCFKALRLVRKFLGHLLKDKPCNTDEYLLSDTYGSKKPGYNFSKALEEYADGNYSPKNSDHCIFDSSKFSTLYAQTHKIASEHADKNIEFTFYDDRTDILFGLKKFYETEAHRKLLPRNTKLKLRIYSGNDVYIIADIEGTGPIDYLYSKSIRDMARIVSKQNVLVDDNNKLRNELIYNEWNFADELEKTSFKASVDHSNTVLKQRG